MTIYKSFDYSIGKKLFPTNKMACFLNDENSLTLVSETYNHISCISHEGFILNIRPLRIIIKTKK